MTEQEKARELYLGLLDTWATSDKSQSERRIERIATALREAKYRAYGERDAHWTKAMKKAGVGGLMRVTVMTKLPDIRSKQDAPAREERERICSKTDFCVGPEGHESPCYRKPGPGQRKWSGFEPAAQPSPEEGAPCRYCGNENGHRESCPERIFHSDASGGGE